MKKQNENFILLNPELFFKDRKGNTFPYTKDDICNFIEDSDSFFEGLFTVFSAMDYPFIFDIWASLESHCDPKELKKILSSYIARMKLCNLKHLKYKHSLLSF